MIFNKQEESFIFYYIKKSTNRTFHFGRETRCPNSMGTYGKLMASWAKKCSKLQAREPERAAEARLSGE